MTKTVCDVCRRVHPGRCTPPYKRSVSMCITIPSYVHSALSEHVPWGDRSDWIAQLITRELEPFLEEPTP